MQKSNLKMINQKIFYFVCLLASLRESKRAGRQGLSRILTGFRQKR